MACQCLGTRMPSISVHGQLVTSNNRKVFADGCGVSVLPRVHKIFFVQLLLQITDLGFKFGYFCSQCEFLFSNPMGAGKNFG